MNLLNWQNYLKIWAAILLGLMYMPVSGQSSAPTAQDNNTKLEQVRAIYTDEIGISTPVGLAFSFETSTFLVLEAGQSELRIMTPFGGQSGSLPLTAEIDDPINITYDARSNRLILFDAAADQLIVISAGTDDELDPATLTRYDAGYMRLQNPQGMAVDPASGTLIILDAAGPRLVRVEPTAEGFAAAEISTVDLQQTELANAQGLALHPATGQLHILNPVAQKLYEVSPEGQLIATRDLSGFDLSHPQGILFAPSGDQTDDPHKMNLYIVDQGLGNAPSQGVTLPPTTEHFQVYLPLVMSPGSGRHPARSLS